MEEIIQEEKKSVAVLAGLNLDLSAQEYATSMKELERLAEALDLEVATALVQNANAVTKRTYIGSGKVEELKAKIDFYDADIVIFNESLSPMQQKNLEHDLDTEVMDRTGLILQIFSQRARTREAKLQVESARLAYLLPRLAGMRDNLSRQGGGSGRLSNKGAGEQKIELDRRHIEHQIVEMNRELKEVDRERVTQRAQRAKSPLPRISLVGYTNAGKSTMMNLLLDRGDTPAGDKKVFEKDMLFATLDTAVRKISVEDHLPFLLSDTVGFISNLPTALVKAFRSTLEEAKYADLLLEVVDYSDPDYEEQIRTTAKTLEAIGAGDIPVIYVYNKADRVPDIKFPQVHGDRVYMSAKTGVGLKELLTLIDATVQKDHETVTFLLSYEHGSTLSRLQERYVPEAIEYLPEGTKITLTLDHADAERIRKLDGVQELKD